MGYYPDTPVGSGTGGSGKPKESATGGVQAGYSPPSGGGGGGGGGGGSGGSTTVTQAEFENQVHAVQAASGVSGKEAASYVRTLQQQGQVVDTNPTVIARVRSKRIQSGFENQVHAVQVATGLNSSQSADVVREAQASGKYVTTDPTVLNQLRTQRTQTRGLDAINGLAFGSSAQPFQQVEVIGSQRGAVGSGGVQDIILTPEITPQSFQQVQTGGRSRIQGIQAPSYVKAPQNAGLITRAGQYFGRTKAGKIIAKELSSGSKATRQKEKEAALRELRTSPEYQNASARKKKLLEATTDPHITYMAVPSTGAISGATKGAITKAAPTLRNIFQVVKGGTKQAATKIPEFARQRLLPATKVLAQTSAEGYIGGKILISGGKAIARTIPPKEQKQVYKEEGYRDIVRQAAKKRDAKLSTFPWYKGVAADIIPFYRPAESDFIESLEAQYKTQGKSPQEIQTAISAVKKERTGAAFGEIAALVNTNRASEKLGTALIGQGFADAASQIFLKSKIGRQVVKRAILPLAVGGTQEGTVGYLLQQEARNRDITVEGAAKSGVYGAVSAVAIGLPIAGFAPNFPRVSRLFRVGGNVADIYEAPGDFLNAVFEGVTVRYGGKINPRPVVVTYTPSDTKKYKEPLAMLTTTQEPGVSFGRAKTNTNTNTKTKTKTKTTPPLPAQIFPTITTTQGPEPSIIVPIAQQIPVPSNTPVPTPGLVPSQTPVQSNTNIPVPTEEDTPGETQPEETQTEEKADTNALTEIFEGVKQNVPVNQPYFRVPPPLPLGFPGSGSKQLGKEGKRFINELDVALGIIPRGPKREQTTKRPRGGLFNTGSLFTRVFVGPTRPRRRRK